MHAVFSLLAESGLLTRKRKLPLVKPYQSNDMVHAETRTIAVDRLEEIPFIFTPPILGDYLLAARWNLMCKILI